MCDGEHYGDQEILCLLKMANVVNLAVFVAHEYGGVQLGNARFKIIKEVATKAIQQLEPEVLHLPPSPSLHAQGEPGRNMLQVAHKTKRIPKNHNHLAQMVGTLQTMTLMDQVRRANRKLLIPRRIAPPLNLEVRAKTKNFNVLY